MGIHDGYWVRAAVSLAICSMSFAALAQSGPDQGETSLITETQDGQGHFGWFIGLFRFSLPDRLLSDSNNQTGTADHLENSVANVTLTKSDGEREFYWTLDPDHHIVGTMSYDVGLEQDTLFPVTSYSRFESTGQKSLEASSDNIQFVDINSLYHIAGTTLSFAASYLNIDPPHELLLPDALSPISYSTTLMDGDGFYTQTGFTWGKWQPWLRYGQWFSREQHNPNDYVSTQLGLTYLLDGDKAKLRIGIENFRSDDAREQNLDAESVSGVRGELYFNF